MNSSDSTPSAPPAPPRLDLLPILRDRPAGDEAAQTTPLVVAVWPFGITESAVRDLVVKWVGKRVAFGRASHANVDIRAVRAEYLPCWAFSAQVRCPWRGETTRTKRNHDGTRETQRVARDGVVERTWEDVAIPAVASASADRLDDIGEFPTSELVGCSVDDLRGYDVPAATIPLKDAWDAASSRMQDELDSSLRSSGCSPESLETWPEWTGQQYRYVLAPVYVMTYVFRGKPREVVVNGATGKVAGQLPFDPIGSALTLLTLVALLGGLGYGFYRVVRWLIGL